MSPAVRRRFVQAAWLGCLAAAGCETDFSPHWEEQLAAMKDAAAPPEPPQIEAGSEAGVDAAISQPPVPDAGTVQPRFNCRIVRRCDSRDLNCPPLCLASSIEIDNCVPGNCNADGFSPVPCDLCIDVVK